MENMTFIEFVKGIDTENLKTFVTNIYTGISQYYNDRVGFGPNGSKEFIGSLLLARYENKTAEEISNGIANVFQRRIGPLDFSNYMDDIVNNSSVPYETWSEVYRYLNDKHSWINLHACASDNYEFSNSNPLKEINDDYVHHFEEKKTLVRLNDGLIDFFDVFNQCNRIENEIQEMVNAPEEDEYSWNPQAYISLYSEITQINQCLAQHLYHEYDQYGRIYQNPYWEGLFTSACYALMVKGKALNRIHQFEKSVDLLSFAASHIPENSYLDMEMLIQTAAKWMAYSNRMKLIFYSNDPAILIKEMRKKLGNNSDAIQISFREYINLIEQNGYHK